MEMFEKWQKLKLAKKWMDEMFPQRCSTYLENLVKKYQSQPELLTF